MLHFSSLLAIAWRFFASSSPIAGEYQVAKYSTNFFFFSVLVPLGGGRFYSV